MNNWFSNVSVTWKLVLGFGLVLLLTCIISGIGWSSLSGLIQRGDRMTGITELNDALTDMRIARLNYILSDGDDDLAAKVQSALRVYEQEQQKIIESSRDPGNLAMLDKQSELTRNYGELLEKMRGAYTLERRARADMGASADRISERQRNLVGLVRRAAMTEEQRFERFDALSRLNDELLRLRFQVRGYIAEASAENEQLVATQLEVAAAALGRLNEVFAPERNDDLAQIEREFETYRGFIVQLKTVNAEIATANAAMVDLAEQIVELSQQLYRFQVDSRDNTIESTRNVQLITTFLALLFGIGAAWLIIRQITLPLRETLEAVERVAAGDLTHDMRVTRRDEIGVLQSGVQRMNVTLNDLISRIRDSVIQIASAAEQLSAVTEQTSAGANTQKIETDQVATAMNEMSATVHEVARNAEEASQAATAADGQARQGDQVVTQAIAQIERLSGEVDRSSEAMVSLQEESNKIGSVMDVIKTVAEQTNLLALNAAIEAARAGEAGRGFAVVADEVRGLAQRTQKSTEEIEALILGLQQVTQQVATIMSSSRDLTASSVVLAREAGESLGGITRTVSNIQAMNQQIAAAAEEQSSVAEEISRSVVSVRDVSEQTAAANEETAASSVELARLGNELQMMVSHFKV
ncbi:methyl-accepting chemotaxis protein [Stutzerimonas kirkiae]|uniref:methyl-accepting chemotaxis protein n=1 Tax=Stutzerimonas kirkiae TaxID=2211392 RepID=UPI0010384ACC|nr:methyl-accepting chemotaxis protein [Stutzerimonas kirkiae]TBV11156.1 methyl-accepting chemotaxis protein [Stutzerimonas kirkiae]